MSDKLLRSASEAYANSLLLHHLLKSHSIASLNAAAPNPVVDVTRHLKEKQYREQEQRLSALNDEIVWMFQTYLNVDDFDD